MARIVSVATCYGLYGPGIKSQSGREFSHQFMTAVGPT